MHKKYLFLLIPFLLFGTSCGENKEEISAEKIVNLEATGVENGVVLTWKANENATSYAIYKNDLLIKETENPFYTVSHLENNVTYKLGVSMKTAYDESEISYVSCKPDSTKDYDPFIDNLNTGLEKRIGSSKVQKMFSAGNINDSNTNVQRFNRVIEKMNSGISQTIAYIGGSITVGEKATAIDDKNHQKGYAYYSYQWLKEHYDKNNNSNFINASISGTDTSIATVRLEKDVLQYNPDLVFVEFCANNGTSEFDKKTYESLIRRILEQSNQPAVMLLFSATSYSKDHQDSYMKPIGVHYSLPMFSFVNAMWQICGNMNTDLSDPIFKFYTPDGVHPNDQGHKLYAKVLCYVLKNLIKSNTMKNDEYSLPETAWKEGYDAYTNLTYINNETNNNAIKSLGSFTNSDTSHRVLKDTADVEAFQKGWKKTTTSSNEAMTIEVTCKSFFIIYMAGNSAVEGDPKGNMVAKYVNKDEASDTAQLIWDVQRTNKQTSIDIIADNGNGWDNPCCIILLDKNTAANYTITISMENDYQIGTLLAFGYCA